MTQVRSSLAGAWPMVTASYLPVGALLLARLFGASVFWAANVALAVTIVLLLIYAFRAGTAAGLSGLRLAAATGTAGALGLAMVVLKTLLQHRHC